MKVKALIEMLTKIEDKEEIVKIWDPDTEQEEPITGMTYGGRDKIVSLYTDEQ